MDNRQKGILAEVGRKLEETVASSQRNIVYMEAILDKFTPELREEFFDTWEKCGDWETLLNDCSDRLLHALGDAMEALDAEQRRQQEGKGDDFNGSAS